MRKPTVATPKPQPIRYDHSISAHNRTFTGYVRVKSSAIIAEFGRLGLPVPQSITDISEKGIRYSFEDFDVLSSAMCALYKIDADVWERIGTSEAR